MLMSWYTVPHLAKLCKTYSLSNLAEPKTIYSIHEDLGAGASTETTGIGFCCVYTRKPTPVQALY